MAKEELIRIRQLKTTYIILLVLSTMDIGPKKLHESLKLPDLCPGLYILMQKAVIINTCHIVWMFLAEQWIRSAWSVGPVLCQLNCCEVRKVDYGDDKTHTQFTEQFFCIYLYLNHPSLSSHSVITNLNIFLLPLFSSFLLVAGWWLSISYTCSHLLWESQMFIHIVKNVIWRWDCPEKRGIGSPNVAFVFY